MRAQRQLRILVIGAHPDDCEYKAGGLAAKYAARGDDVLFVSMTNGDAGHYAMGGNKLAQRRRAEAQAVAEVIGIGSRVLDHHDGQLEATMENRRTTIRLIRDYRPDLILTHRPNDYHPDHRYTSILVQDASFLVCVPNVCSDTPALERAPVIAYLSDDFRKPAPFTADVAVAIDDVVEQKLEMLHCHASQFYDWLAWLEHALAEVPDNEADRRAWLRSRRITPHDPRMADTFRDVLVRWYGEERGRAIRHAEAFELCEYGRQPDEAEIRRLFPFFGK